MTRHGPVVALVLGVVVAFAIPWARPFARDQFVKTLAWAVSNMAAFAGWGTMLARFVVPTQRPSLALRVVWGASVLACVGGVFATVSLVSRGALLTYAVVGNVALVHHWITTRGAIGQAVRVRVRATRLHLGAFAVVLFLVVAVLVRFLGAASDTTSNPYDDEAAYFTFAKMLLEKGTTLDPFSFRRMSTLGGQALFHALLLTKIDIFRLNVFDRGMCIAVVAGLVGSFRIGGKKPPLAARFLAVLFFVALPDTSINTASYYSGVAFFLALAQTLELLGDAVATTVREAARRVVPLALVGAATCTLRQNYQAAVGLFVVFSYVLALRRLRAGRPWKAMLVEPVVALGLIGAFVFPWMIVLFQSNGTFIFPIMKGTFNPQIDVKSQLMTRAKVARFAVEVWLTPEPMHTQTLFVAAALVARDRSGRGVMKSFAFASAIAVVLLAAAFSLSDSGNLARYYYGFVMASSLVTWLWFSTQISGKRWSSATLIPFALAMIALLAPVITFVRDPNKTAKLYARLLRDTDEQLRRTVPAQAEHPAAGIYRRLQAAVPPGASILYMIDQPHFFDFARNPLFNLDTPGLASPRPGMPNFDGPEAMASYLATKDIRYVAYVRPARSTFFYRTELFLSNVYDTEELWRAHAPYILDTMRNIDTLAATRKILHEEDGMVVFDLAEKTAPTKP